MNPREHDSRIDWMTCVPQRGLPEYDGLIDNDLSVDVNDDPIEDSNKMSLTDDISELKQAACQQKARKI